VQIDAPGRLRQPGEEIQRSHSDPKARLILRQQPEATVVIADSVMRPMRIGPIRIGA
jgi:hypothetical protein